ncbi:MAG: PQQ-dependent sugar dehydrogenase [Candidatus Adiutricales bacterium]
MAVSSLKSTVKISLTALNIGIFLSLVFFSVKAVQAQQNIELFTVASGLSHPVAITHAGDGTHRLFITLQEGRIMVLSGNEVLPDPFLDIRTLVLSGGERGLLSVAFHPDYATNGLFFVNYTNTSGNTVIARYSVSSNPNVANPNSASIILTQAQPFANHNGGQLNFGPDGFLYIGMGDGGSGGDPQNNAQNLGTILGKMLRINVDQGLAYSIPPDNPFAGSATARREIWALGLRNPWRFSFDRLTGDMFIADVGQISFEEVNFQPSSSSGGENYGWRFMEGLHCFDPPVNCDNGHLTPPILEYDHSLGISITGGYRYRGSQNPSLVGTYFYADFGSGRIWGASQDSLGQWTTEVVLDTNLSITTFGEDEAGELYLAHYSPTSGSIIRLASRRPAADTASGTTSSGGSCYVFTLYNHN